MNGYVCFWQGQQCEVHADTALAARDKAVVKFQAMAGRRKVKAYDVTAMLAEKDGEQVTHSTAGV